MRSDTGTEKKDQGQRADDAGDYQPRRRRVAAAGTWVCGHGGK
ncbi:hypothetical protein I552_1049 [Mycobacterium xenopi 3993]|nr:hypothetical protein I552_1049 [Mycobacterium xenopi 3993]